MVVFAAAADDDYDAGDDDYGGEDGADGGDYDCGGGCDDDEDDNDGNDADVIVDDHGADGGKFSLRTNVCKLSRSAKQTAALDATL